MNRQSIIVARFLLCAAAALGDVYKRQVETPVLKDGSSVPVKAAVEGGRKLEILEPRRARLTLTEGKYHQVRRMLAAVGAPVASLCLSLIHILNQPDPAFVCIHFFRRGKRKIGRPGC